MNLPIQKIKRTHPQCSECVQNVRILSVSLKNFDNLLIYFYAYNHAILDPKSNKIRIIMTIYSLFIEAFKV